MVAIIDYGMGNIHSVQKAMESFGAKVVVTNNADEIKKHSKLVLPGVGAFNDAAAELKKQGLVQAIKEHVGQKKVFLGICLGMQLLFEISQEAKSEKGMGLIKGRVVRFTDKDKVKIPHIGWNQLNKVNPDCPLMRDIPDNPFVYFCHSYFVQPKNKTVIAASTNYGRDFTSMIWQGNTYGVQFHPEKSQSIGLRILKNFIEL